MKLTSFLMRAVTRLKSPHIGNVYCSIALIVESMLAAALFRLGGMILKICSCE